MKNYLKVDVAESRLVMDRTFAKNCAIAGSAEYNLLQSARRDYPKTGKVVIPFEWDYANSFSEGLSLVRKDSKWGFIDTNC